MPKLEAAVVGVKHRIAEELEALDNNDLAVASAGNGNSEKLSDGDQRLPSMAGYWPSPNCVTFEFFDVVAPLVPGESLLPHRGLFSLQYTLRFLCRQYSTLYLHYQ